MFFKDPSFLRCNNVIRGGNIPHIIETGYFPEKVIACRKTVEEKEATNNEGTAIRAPIFILVCELSVPVRKLVNLDARMSLYDDSSARYTPIIVVRIAVTDNEKRGNLTIPGVLNRTETGSMVAVAPTGVKAVANAAQPTINPSVPRDPNVKAI